jgi:hypothetical protein
MPGSTFTKRARVPSMTAAYRDDRDVDGGQHVHPHALNGDDAQQSDGEAQHRHRVGSSERETNDPQGEVLFR